METEIMALTRKSLKAMGLTDEQVDSIIEMHTETVNGLKDALETAQAGAKELPALQKKVELLEADLEAAKKDGWKDRHDKVKKEFDEYKAGITAKETREAKEKAARAYFESKNILGKSLDVAMRGSREEISALELDGDRIKDTAALDALIKGDFAGLVSATSIRGADTATPPAVAGGRAMTKEEILAIPDRAEKRMQMAKHKELFSGGNT